MFKNMGITEFLEKTRLTDKQIADAVEVHKTQVYRWKKGLTHPSGRALMKLLELARHRTGVAR